MKPPLTDKGQRGQRIANADFGEDIARLRRISLEFTAQAIDVDLQHVILAQVFGTPDVYEEQILCDDAPSILRQVRNDAVLGGSKHYLFPRLRCQALGIIDGQVRCAGSSLQPLGVFSGRVLSDN